MVLAVCVGEDGSAQWGGQAGARGTRLRPRDLGGEEGKGAGVTVCVCVSACAGVFVSVCDCLVAGCSQG